MKHEHRIITGGLCVLILSTAVCADPNRQQVDSVLDWTIPKSHPRLFVNRGDLAALRVRCGIDRYHDDPAARARGIRFGSQRDILDRLKAVAGEIMRSRARPDDLWVPAVLHLATGQLGRADRFTEYVTSELLDPDRRRLTLDAVVALDYCWDAFEREKRSRITERLAGSLQPFDPGENPLNCTRFDRKLCALALALVLADEPVSSQKPELTARVRTVLSAARAYLEGVFIRFCRQRGAMPSSGGNGPREEATIVLAAEIWRTGAGRSIWPKLTDSIGRAMEHYFYADTDYATMTHGFIHDDGSTVPIRPGQIYRGFIPAVPWAIARNTRDPIATWYANRSLPMELVRMPPEVERYQWVRLIYGPLEQAEAARRACPLGRNFGGGWVAMRSGWDPGETVVLFDAGQPFWRARQHFDAGQFQIYRKQRLAIDSGDDVTHEAVPRKGGRTTIGTERGDWDHYFQATIAHNCVTVTDRSRGVELYGRLWPAMGNQRLIGHDYDLAAGDVTQTDRCTGRLTAFETNSFYTYAAADLTPAYPPEVVTSIQRRMLFVNAGALLVLDRVRAVGLRSIKTWHLQLPTRPRFLGGTRAAARTRPEGRVDKTGPLDLGQARQVHGTSEQAGIWELGASEPWLEVTHRHGRLYVRTLLPEEPRRRVMGGPMQARKISGGPMAGRDYYGGDPLGYEHRLGPAVFLHAPNAAYTLGRPMSLGEHVGVGATWGRLDVSPITQVDQVTFLHLLIPTDQVVHKPPTVRFERLGQRAIVDIELIEQNAHVELALDEGPPGKVSIQDRLTREILFETSLASTVRPNLPIPGSGH